MTKELIIADLRSNCSYHGISTGHFVPVAKMYQQIFKNSYSVKIAGGPVYNKYFSDSELIKLPNNVSGDSLFHKIKVLQNSLTLFRCIKGKTLILQQSADFTTHLALALFYWGGAHIYLIRYSNEGISSWLKRVIYSLCKKKIDGIICPNDLVGKAYNRPYIVVPDYIYIDKATPLGTSPKKSIKKYDFCIVGRIAEEKGIAEVARWIENKEFSIIIAGKAQTEELAFELQKICNNAKNITLKLGYVSDEEYNSILEQSKFAFMNYQGEYSRRSSGVVFDTLFAGIPVIGKRCKALNFIEQYGVGYLYDSLSSITPIEIRELLQKNYEEDFLNNIIKYRNTHKKYLELIIRFISSH